MTLKQLAFNLIYLLVPTCIFAQDSQTWKREEFDLHEFAKEKIRLQPFHSNITLKYINHILVIDARADSMPIGFRQRIASYNKFFLVLQNGVARETEEFVNHYFSLSQADTACKVIMVLKKLWLTDELEFTHLNSSEKLTDTIQNWTSGIIVKIEFYLQQKSDYYPLYRFDTIYSRPLNIGEAGAEFLQRGIIFSLSRLSQLDEKLPGIHTRKLSWEEIENYNEQRFDLPILKDSVLSAGVYRSFEEFKKNAPSQKEYTLKKSKLNDMIYVRQPDGTEVAERNVWGYCDGKKIFLRSVDNFFQLQRQGNAFYIYGAKVLKNKHAKRYSATNKFDPSNPPYPEMPEDKAVQGAGADADVLAGANLNPSQGPTRKLRLIFKPYQLDWDDGEIY